MVTAYILVDERQVDELYFDSGSLNDILNEVVRNEIDVDPLEFIRQMVVVNVIVENGQSSVETEFCISL